MTTVREPLLKTVAILDLRPTQITVGMREVKAKRKRWRDESTKKGEEFLGKHMIPVILGPKGRHYVMDNRDWTHPFVDGRRRPYSDLPKSVDKLIDDPFRSLAGELRRAGGFAKDTTPFNEFLGPNFYGGA